MGAPKIDEIGPWSEVKLDIIKRYATAYSRILSNQKASRTHTSMRSQVPGTICPKPQAK
jgi:hypothetical protein